MVLGRLPPRPLAILAAAMAGVAFLDLLEPGRGTFINPIHQGRRVIDQYQMAQWIAQHRVTLDDPRLLTCDAIAADPVALDATVADLRRTLVGESEVLTLTALGGPACDLGQGVYRWLLNNGLAVDITVQEGNVTHAELSR